MPDEVLYCYAVVRSGGPLCTLDSLHQVTGVSGADVLTVSHGDLAVLVSRLAASEWTVPLVEERSADIGWLGEQAVAHDRVVTWASDREAVLPLPVLSLFADPGSVRDMLSERDAELRSTIERVTGAREYGVRITRDDDALTARLAELSDDVKSLESEAATASPGQAFLLRRKLEAQRRDALNRVSIDIVQELHEALASKSRAAVLRPLPSASQTRRIVLDAAYLVPDDSLDGFRASLTSELERRARDGFTGEFTGPWPPYHFVRDEQGGLDA